MVRAVLIVCFLVAVVSTMAPRYADKFFASPTASSALAAKTPEVVKRAAQTTNGHRTITLRSDSRGHFAVEARVDGRTVDFVIDTGASKIVLRETAAARLGIFPRASEYTGRAQTANGVARFAPVRLNSVDVNGITVRDVDAAVMPDDALQENLLGMTFLSRVKWSHDRGKLVLEQ